MPSLFALSKPKQRETSSFGWFNPFHRPATAPKISDAEFLEHEEYNFKQLKKERKKGHGDKIQSNKEVESPLLALFICISEVALKLVKPKFHVRSQW